MNVYKQPVTDPGKKSKKGRLTLEYSDGQYKTVEEGKGDPKKVNLHLVPKVHIACIGSDSWELTTHNISKLFFFFINVYRL